MMKLLSISPVVQKKGRLCWATCIEMVLKLPHIHLPLSQQEIYKKNNLIKIDGILLDTRLTEQQKNEKINILKGENNYVDLHFCDKIAADDDGNFVSLDSKQEAYEAIFEKHSITSCKVKGGFILQETIKNQLDSNQCLILSNVMIPNIQNHAFLIIGYLEIGNKFHISVNDPYIYYNYPEDTFESCGVSIGGRACFVYQNLYYINNKFCNVQLPNILILSNFKSSASMPDSKVNGTQLDIPKAYTTLKSALEEFDTNFLNKIYGFEPNLSIRPSVKCFSIDYINDTEAYKNYQKKSMVMPIFKTNDISDNHWLEFMYYVDENIHNPTPFIPICIRQPYFNGYLKIHDLVMPDGTTFILNHESPNYVLVNVTKYNYNFIGFQDLNNNNNNTFYYPFEKYNEIEEIVYSEFDFNSLIADLKLDSYSSINNSLNVNSIDLSTFSEQIDYNFTLNAQINSNINLNIERHE